MKYLIRIIQLTILFTIVWIASILLVNFITDYVPPSAGNDQAGLLLILLTCLLETLVMDLYIRQLSLSRWPRFTVIWVSLFVLQFVLTQMETWFYIGSESIPTTLVLNTVYSGLLATGIFALFATYSYPSKVSKITLKSPVIYPSIVYILVLGLLVYPGLYFLAGYFIAWQNEGLRVYYTGTAQLQSFPQVMHDNLNEGIVYFQMARGVFWAALGWFLTMVMIPKSKHKQALILGLLFATIMNAQLLIPNPYMSDPIRLTHAIETGSSNFLWGMIVVYCYRYVSSSIKDKIPVANP